MATSQGHSPDGCGPVDRVLLGNGIRDAIVGPTVPSSPESAPPPIPPARITATWEVTVTEYGPNQPRTFHQGGTKQWSIDLSEEARKWF